MMLKTFLLLLLAFFTMCCVGQSVREVRPDLEKLVAGKKLTVFNRDITLQKDLKNNKSLYLNAKDNYGVAWLTGYQLTNGVLEFDVKGRDVLQQSFVGIAFHGVNDSTMEVVYFRPFNFRAADTIRRSHAVQYISLPEHDWKILRTDYPNQYEQGLRQPPQPDEWFHVRVVIDNADVKVFVNNRPEPDLVVTRLSNRAGGRIGFWTGHQSDGSFANLKMILK
ncbi:hypothetical protein LQ567_13400 [Niabella pedocola]|uniref:3-keto-disaccharide hydrolase domain-containing protein n=1 Tax=Niabella pedocola TaxID=1752077 RepID=A0ABS8PRQ6_9BACT|nr:hypothetical protein [Niabella pedocola]MCD2423765.1 hypothetical protein [Niabella pedocola]